MALNFIDSLFASLLLSAARNRGLTISEQTRSGLQTDIVKAYIQELLTEDAGALYVQQLERNALDESGSGTRLGLLTMIDDYDARLAQV